MTKYELIKFRDNQFELDVNVSPEEDTVWLTIDQIALLFNRDRTVISRHINNIHKEEEIDKNTSVHFLHISSNSVNPDHRPPSYYNLDVIISVGYRVRSKRGILFRKWANNVLKQYLLKGYVVDNERVTISKANFIQMENDISKIKSEIKETKEKTFIEPVKQRLFYDGQYFDAYDFVCSLVESANTSIIIIDPYFDEAGLHYLEKRKDGVKIYIYVSNKGKLNENDVRQFEKQYGHIVITKTDAFHDRFIFIDNFTCYSLGSSLNYMGKRVFSVNLINDKDIINLILEKLKKI